MSIVATSAKSSGDRGGAGAGGGSAGEGHVGSVAEEEVARGPFKRSKGGALRAEDTEAVVAIEVYPEGTGSRIY